MENYSSNYQYGGGNKKWINSFRQNFLVPFANKIPMTAAIIIVTIICYLISLISLKIYFGAAFFPPLAFSEPWRFFSAALLHADWLHLFFNMYSLWLLGAVIETALGKWKYLGLYVFSVFIGNLFAYGYAVLTGEIMILLVGASGGIFGLFGALLVLTRHISGNTKGIMIMLGLNLVVGVLNPQISWQAHVGGFLGGALYMSIVIGILKVRNRLRKRY